MVRKLVGIFTIALMIGSASFATAGIPDLTNSSADIASAGSAETPVLYSTPNGAGNAFSAAGLSDGSSIDATITVTLIDGSLAAIPNFPFEDVWLEASDGGLAYCTGGSTADFNTDASGVTTFGAPMNAGGSSVAVTNIVVSGAALDDQVALWHNSSDMNGDGSVNLTDVIDFAGFFFGTYDVAADFAYDGLLNLSDVILLAQANGSSCP